jgi:adenosylhomocysteine nucleosidase
MAAVPDLTPMGDLAVLFVMATEQEYGEHLKRRIRPVITGVGPVEAAVGTSIALGELERAGRRPDLVVSLGTAGSARLDHAGIYQVSSIAYRDMDASPLGFEKGVTPFTGQPAVIAIPQRIPDVRSASISTGGDIISGKRYDAIDADMVDMETYAVFRSAERLGIPVIGLRGISDGRSDLTGLHDWLEFLHILDEKLALVLDDLKGHIAEGRFRL